MCDGRLSDVYSQRSEARTPHFVLTGPYAVLLHCAAPQFPTIGPHRARWPTQGAPCASTPPRASDRRLHDAPDATQRTDLSDILSGWVRLAPGGTCTIDTSVTFTTTVFAILSCHACPFLSKIAHK